MNRHDTSTRLTFSFDMCWELQLFFPFLWMLDKNFKSINNARGFFASQSTQGDNGDEINVHTKKNVMEISPKDFKHLLCENKFISIMMIFLRPAEINYMVLVFY